jgi:hypothetical protein
MGLASGGAIPIEQKLLFVEDVATLRASRTLVKYKFVRCSRSRGWQRSDKLTICEVQINRWSIDWIRKLKAETLNNVNVDT